MHRPVGSAKPSDFAIVESGVAEPDDGQALVRNLFMSIDAGALLRVNGTVGYAPSFEPGEALSGRAVGEVVASRVPGVEPGDIVVTGAGWREHAVVDAAGLEPVDRGVEPLSLHLGALGVTGLAAHVGMLELGRPLSGETVLVSAAAGGVGSLAGQLARLAGSRVVGIAGGPRKVAFVRDVLGFDDVLDHRGGDLAEALRAACPQGVDLYFDNVGGDQLELALGHMRHFGRVIACGMISGYDSAEARPGPRNLMEIVNRRLTIRGFIAYDYGDRRADVAAELSAQIADGRLVAPESVVDGIENAPAALLGLLAGENVGKLVVRVSKRTG